ncbi:MAG: hypothetical protein RQ761_07575, partial [Bacteroidales bacterium]|nr:hypothetical protein [Bacteroidales bacterium]
PEWFVYDPVDDAGNTITFEALNKGGDITGVEFQYLAGLKVFLQGAYDANENLMRAEITDDLPLNASEAYSHLSYSGLETVDIIPADVVDWVLVELRDAVDASSATASTTVDIVAGFIKKDGSIVSVDGVSGLPFKSTLNNNPYFVIHHRNHLSVMTASSPIKPKSTYEFDFTDAATKAFSYGSKPALISIDTSPDVYGLFAGDAINDGLISYGDRQPVRDLIDNSITTGYHNADTNMDGLISYGDEQLISDNIKNAKQLPY